MKEQLNFVGFLNTADDSDLNSIRFVKKLFISQTGSSVSNFELLCQNIVVGKSLYSFSIVVRNL